MATSVRARIPVDLLVATVVSLVVLGPLVLLPGYSLRGDMVFVPDMPWKDAWLGLDGSAPRAVPMDALVSVATYVVPGWLVQKALLLAALVVGGIGAGRLVRDEPAYARAAAIVLFLWNPWVAERLSIGQWAIVAGYCTLPLLALAARRARDDVRRGWPYLVVAMVACAVCSPSSGLMGGLVVLAVVLGRPRVASLGVATATVVIANLPWLVPSMLLQGGSLGQGPEFSSFAARAESAGRPARERPVRWAASGSPRWCRGSGRAPSSCCVRGGHADRDRRPARRPRRPAAAGRAGRDRGDLLRRGVPAGPGRPALLARRRELIGAGLALLRDSHRFLGPAVLMLLPGFAAAVRWLAEQRRPGREAVVVLAGVVALLPVLLLPSLAWGLTGKLAPSSYPREWDTVAGILASEDDGRTIVLPWYGSYRGFEWNRDQAVLDPAPRYLPGPVLIDDSLVLGDTVLPPESDDGAAVGRALESADPAEELRALGCPVGARGEGHGGRVGATRRGRAQRSWSGPGRPRSRRRDRRLRTAPAVVLAADGLVIGALGAAVATLLDSTAAHRRVTQEWAGWSQVGYAAYPDVSLLVSTCMLPPPDLAWEGPS